ncbi:MAG: carboxypeptidase regulatory-like domain-containing protein [Planctomycetota bacterium]
MPKSATAVVIGTVLVGAAAVAWLALGEERTPWTPPAPPSAVAAPDEAPAAELTAGPSRPGAPTGRTAALMPAAAGDPDADPATEDLAVSGRVVDAQNQPVTGARIRVLHRGTIDFSALRGRGGPPPGDRSQWRALFRRRPLGPAVHSAPDGTFRLEGASSAEADLVVTVQHRDHAPELLNKTWRAADGVLAIGDVVLSRGLTVRGTVVDDRGQPVAGAEVAYEAESGGFFGRGGPGGRGGRGRRFGDQDTLSSLVEPAESDANGRFALGPLPADAFQLRAEAPRHVAGRSESLEPDVNGVLPDAEIMLAVAAQLRGVVRDHSGGMVAKARVVAVPATEDAERDGRGRGRWFGGGRTRGPRDSAVTNPGGEFELTRVPPGAVRIEIEHPDFQAATLNQIQPAQTPWLEITLEPAAVASGVVLDAATNQPVEMFAIAARPADGEERGGRGRGDPSEGRRSRGGRGDGANESRRQADEQWQQERLGGVGEIPRDTPEPTRHEGGRFELRGLEPGEYVLDVAAPGYVKVAAARIELGGGVINAPVTLRVERGAVLVGRVQLANGEPVARARVEVRLTEPPGREATAEPERGRRPGFMRRGGFRSLARTRTDAQGAFELPPLRAGAFELRVTADGLLDHREEVDLPARGLGRPLTVTMAQGATIQGVVLGLPPGQGGMVMALGEDGPGSRSMARVDPATGEYELRGLTPGGYFVTFMEPGNGSSMRGALARLVTPRSGGPDVNVGEGQIVRHDLNVDGAEVGSVEGTIWLNGNVATGMRVRLAPTAEPTANSEGSAARFLAQRLWTDRTDADGSFAVEAVPPGSYELLVERDSGRRGGRGGGSRGTLHRETVLVTTGRPTARRIEIRTAQVEIRVRSTGELQRASATLVPVADVGEQPPERWRRLPSAVSLPIQEGTTGAQEVPPGAYRFAVSGRDITTVTGELTASLGAPVAATVDVSPATTQEPR